MHSLGSGAPRGAPSRSIVGVIVTGTFLVALDVSLINVALPAMGRDFGAGPELNWVLLGYLVAVAVAQPPSAWIAGRLGRMPAFALSVGVFAVGALVGALAPSLLFVIIGRIIQGLGAGAVFPIGLAVIHDAVPEGKRGSAFGWWGAATMAAPALAPVLAGAVLAFGPWRTLFVLDFVVAVVAVALIRRIRVVEPVVDRTPLDAVGLALSGTGLIMLLVGLDGWKSTPLLSWSAGGLILGGLACLGFFIGHELRTDSPLLDMRIFRTQLFTLSIVLVWLLAAVQYARILIVPIELQSVYDLTAFQAGLAVLPAGIATAITMRVGGRLHDVVGPRLPVLMGIAIASIGAWQLANIQTGTPLAWVVIALFIQGLGVGVSMLPTTVVSMTSVPERLVGQAAAVNSINRQIAGVLAIAVLAVVISSRAGSVVADGVSHAVALAGYNDAYRIVLVTLGLAAVAACALPGGVRLRKEAAA